MKSLFLLALLILVSCHDSQSEKIAELENKVSLMETEKHKADSINSITSSKNTINDEVYKQLNSSKFYFIVLETVELANVYEKKSFFRATRIGKLENYNDEVKYQLLDEIVSEYNKSPQRIADEGKIKDRHIYLFNSYPEASKAREKYIIEK